MGTVHTSTHARQGIRNFGRPIGWSRAPGAPAGEDRSALRSSESGSRAARPGTPGWALSLGRLAGDDRVEAADELLRPQRLLDARREQQPRVGDAVRPRAL